jgi:DNA-binding NtrC family response regulator
VDLGVAVTAHQAAEPRRPICLGTGAPEAMAEFLTRAGLEVVPYAQRHHSGLYVDFLGARPSGVEVLSIELTGKSGEPSRPHTHFTTDNWQSAACFVISHTLRLRPPLLTADAEMLSVIRSAMSVATSQVPVILSGEIGVGKASLAHLVHSASRCRAPLLVVNCSSLDNIETDALLGSLNAAPNVNSRPGPDSARLDATIFLDEVGELTDSGQLKLLRMLQAAERAAWPQPGARGAVSRFVAATNRQLPAMVERGELRKELYWRLNVFSLEVPPLRQRPGDIAMLARYFLRRANPRRAFTPMALKMLSNYAFPGNVLELEGLVTRLAISPLAAGNTFIDVADLRRHLMVAAPGEQMPVSAWKSSREEARREMILKAIAAAGGDRAEAARRLHISTRALQYHITKAGLSRRRQPRPAAETSAPALDPAAAPSRSDQGSPA